MTNAIVTFSAKQIAQASFHCHHEWSGEDTFKVPNDAITAYIDGTPEDLLAAARSLRQLADDRRYGA